MEPLQATRPSAASLDSLEAFSDKRHFESQLIHLGIQFALEPYTTLDLHGERVLHAPDRGVGLSRQVVEDVELQPQKEALDLGDSRADHPLRRKAELRPELHAWAWCTEIEARREWRVVSARPFQLDLREVVRVLPGRPLLLDPSLKLCGYPLDFGRRLARLVGHSATLQRSQALGVLAHEAQDSAPVPDCAACQEAVVGNRGVRVHDDRLGHVPALPACSCCSVTEVDVLPVEAVASIKAAELVEHVAAQEKERGE